MTTHKGSFIKNSIKIDDAVAMDIAIAIRLNASLHILHYGSRRARSIWTSVIHYANAHLTDSRRSICEHLILLNKTKSQAKQLNRTSE